MKYKNKILIIILLFVIIIPNVQANVFDDIRSIDEGVAKINETLERIESESNEMKKTMENVSGSVVLIEETNDEIEEMNEKLEEVSTKISDALEITDKFDSYAEDIKLLILVGISTIILAILTLIGTTLVILKRRK